MSESGIGAKDSSNYLVAGFLRSFPQDSWNRCTPKKGKQCGALAKKKAPTGLFVVAGRCGGKNRSHVQKKPGFCVLCVDGTPFGVLHRSIERRACLCLALAFDLFTLSLVKWSQLCEDGKCMKSHGKLYSSQLVVKLQRCMVLQSPLPHITTIFSSG